MHPLADVCLKPLTLHAIVEQNSSAVHDKKRKKAHENAEETHRILIKNGKFFVAPQKTSDSFKVLFARLAAEGAGRPVDRHGIADGPWEPESLAEAISCIEANSKGIELRAVQVWFQDNDNGISNENIRWLARIFGCNDPEETSKWQVELKASKDRLASERRERRRRASEEEASTDQLQKTGSSSEVRKIADPIAPANAPRGEPSVRAARTLAEKCEWMLSGSASMNLLIAYWLVFCGLGLMNYVFNTLSVTYSPLEGLEKQVGFIWAPTLTVLPLIALPLFIFFVSDLNTYWKRVGRSKCTARDVMSVHANSHAGWYAKINNFSAIRLAK